MNTTLRIDTACGVVTANQAPTTTSAMIEAEQSTTEVISSAIVEAEKTTTEAISNWVQRSAPLAPVILEGFVGVLAVLYLLGGCTLAAALLFYTFNR